MANCSSSASRSLSRVSRSTWSSDAFHPPRDGAPFCATTARISRPWTCSWSPTIGFKLLYGLIIIRLQRRELVWINVTTQPTAEWVARQIAEAFSWEQAPRHLIRDLDQLYGTVVRHRLRAMGIRDKPIAPGSPWQNAYAERLIGSIRRECLDHMVIMSEAHLRRTLQAYASYYNDLRTHRSLDKDAPLSRPVQRVGRITSLALLGGLHHQYVRI